MDANIATAATTTDTTNAIERLMPASMGPALDASGGTTPRVVHLIRAQSVLAGLAGGVRQCGEKDKGGMTPALIGYQLSAISYRIRFSACGPDKSAFLPSAVCLSYGQVAETIFTAVIFM